MKKDTPEASSDREIKNVKKDSAPNSKSNDSLGSLLAKTKAKKELTLRSRKSLQGRDSSSVYHKEKEVKERGRLGSFDLYITKLFPARRYSQSRRRVPSDAGTVQTINSDTRSKMSKHTSRNPPGSQIIRKKRSLFNRLSVRSNKGKIPINRQWLLPEARAMEGDGRYVLRSSDLIFLKIPSLKLTFTFGEKLLPGKIFQGLQKAINRYPIVAGKLEIREPKPVVLDGEDEFFTDTLDDSILEPAAYKMHFVVDDEAREGNGVLLEIVEQEDSSLEAMLPQRLFAPKLGSKGSEPIFKARLTQTGNKSIIAIESNHMLADWHSLCKFIQTWSLFSKETLTLNEELQMENPALDRDLQLDFEEYLTLESTNTAPLKPTLNDQTKTVLNRVSISVKPKVLHDLELNTEQIREIREEFMRVFSEASVKTEKDLKLFELSQISDYEILTAIGVCIWKLLKNQKETEFKGVFAVNLRGRLGDIVQYNYFGNAFAYPKFSFHLDENNTTFKHHALDVLTPLLYNALLGVARAYHTAAHDKQQLLSMEKTYEALFSNKKPLNNVPTKKIGKIQFQKPILDFATGNIPMFTFCTGQDCDFSEFKFADVPIETVTVLSNAQNAVHNNQVMFYRSSKEKVIMRFSLSSEMKQRWKPTLEKLKI